MGSSTARSGHQLHPTRAPVTAATRRRVPASCQDAENGGKLHGFAENGGDPLRAVYLLRRFAGWTRLRRYARIATQETTVLGAYCPATAEGSAAISPDRCRG
ncbi:hypothetical protein [Arthrobacter alpinus]|uniref:hypothetical protein n=1 Tax=Arthrobacter alpinus TaxID=656366 RepID=UPI001646359A|nr:hypothetical protein [Arthrobacter alpinus]